MPPDRTCEARTRHLPVTATGGPSGSRAPGVSQQPRVRQSLAPHKVRAMTDERRGLQGIIALQIVALTATLAANVSGDFELAGSVAGAAGAAALGLLIGFYRRTRGVPFDSGASQRDL